jgi:hypothetical protein
MEKRYLDAMGANYTDKDVLNPPLLSAQHFEDVLKDWLRMVDDGVGRDKAIVMHVGKCKDDLKKAGINLTTDIQNTCKRSALPLRLLYAPS